MNTGWTFRGRARIKSVSDIPGISADTEVLHLGPNYRLALGNHEVLLVRSSAVIMPRMIALQGFGGGPACP